jgi:hypothetical protein
VQRVGRSSLPVGLPRTQLVLAPFDPAAVTPGPRSSPDADDITPTKTSCAGEDLSRRR